MIVTTFLSVVVPFVKLTAIKVLLSMKFVIDVVIILFNVGVFEVSANTGFVTVGLTNAPSVSAETNNLLALFILCLSFFFINLLTPI